MTGYGSKGDRVWLNSQAVQKGQSCKFHLEYVDGPYVVLERLGAIISYRNPEQGKEKWYSKMLRIAEAPPRHDYVERTDQQHSDLTTNEPGISHQEIPTNKMGKQRQQGEPAPSRRSAYRRRLPERYQHYALCNGYRDRGRSPQKRGIM